MRFSVILLIFINCVDASKILGFFAISAKSHYRFLSPILSELAERGHNLTIYTLFPLQMKNAPNVNVISIEKCLIPLFKNSTISDTKLTTIDMLNIFYNSIPKYEQISNCSPIMNLIESTDEYDVLLTVLTLPTWHSLFAYKFKIPIINIFPNLLFPQLASLMGAPSNPSYIPTFVSGFASPMSFLERVQNLYIYITMTVGNHYYLSSRVNDLGRRLFGENVPSVEEMVKNTSLVLSNIDFSYHSAVPVAPNVIPIAGVNVKDAEPLPEVSRCFFKGGKNKS